MTHQGGEGGERAGGEIFGHGLKQAAGRRLRGRPAHAVSGRNAAGREQLLELRDEFLRHSVGHANGDLLGREPAAQPGQPPAYRAGLPGGGVGLENLPVVQFDGRFEPRFGLKAAVFVEPVGQGLGREHEGRHVLGHLIEHEPLLAVQVGRAYQHDGPLRGTLALFDGHAAGRLPVPQFKRIEDVQVTLLHPGQRLPAGRFTETVQRRPHGNHVAKVEVLACQLAVQAVEHRSQGKPRGEVVGRRQHRQQALDHGRLAAPKRVDPGKLLRQVVGERSLGRVQLLGQVADGDDSRRAKRRPVGLGPTDQQFHQATARPAGRHGQHHVGQVERVGRAELLGQVIDGRREARALEVAEDAANGHGGVLHQGHRRTRLTHCRG